VPSVASQPLLVFGPRSLDYDFGPSHPLTPRRFGPGIDLLRALGAEPDLAPEPAADGELLRSHTRHYLDIVKRCSEVDLGWMEVEAGIGSADNPAFHGMHEAAAAVAGGSFGAMAAILRGDVEHAFHPGGGLHHAMPARASGFCIYNDPALAIAVAREAGLRVLYVDLDVHHGDGVEAIHATDPGVLTVSFHETTRTLFPYVGGLPDEIGEGRATGTVVNVPLEPGTGEAAWLRAVRGLLPELAAGFRPDIVVSQHGADSHAWDPLAHLHNSTTAMGEAARIVDAVAHRWAGGRWLATGGGGYGVYDVVPRSWSLVWLAGAHADPPDRLPAAWRDRWADEAARYGVRSLPGALTDPPNVGDPVSPAQAAAERASDATAAAVRAVVVPRILQVAVERGWWDVPGPAVADRAAGSGLPSVGHIEPTIVASVDSASWAGLRVADQVLSVRDGADAHQLVAGGLRGRASVSAALLGEVVIGLAVSAPDTRGGGDPAAELLALGVAPGWRRRGVGTALLRAHVATCGAAPIRATVTVAERDPVEPEDRGVRRDIASRLLTRAGFEVRPAGGATGRLDPGALEATRPRI
jgi:acetoin utilization protein AcuC